ncbi:MAG: DUF4293 domain-containing protein [Saprospiraceae bacterium]|nr:DUF4293 domain-containing protein [Saprospiraceae bacterium]
MIQRIQSVFLLLAAIIMAALFKIPFAMSDQAASPFFEDKLFNVLDHTVLTVLVALGSIVALVAIFMFRNRNLQLRLGYLGIIASLFLALVAFWLVYSNADTMGDAVIEDQFGLYMPPLALVFFILANHFIKKDQKTVDSMDRLR